MVANVDLGLGDAVILIDREGNWTYHITPTGVIVAVGLASTAYIAYEWYWWVGQFWAHDHVGASWNTRAMFDYVQKRVNMTLDWIENLMPDIPKLPWPF